MLSRGLLLGGYPGIYHTTQGLPVFHAVRAPTLTELQTLLLRIINRLMKFLTRKGPKWLAANGNRKKT